MGNNPKIMPGPPEVFQSYGLSWANASNTPFRRYKHWVHEGGIATPLIVHWPAGAGSKPGALTNQVGHVIDILPTCLDLAGADYPETFHGHALTPPEGRSLRPLIEGRAEPEDRTLFWEHEGNRAVRQGRWKLVAVHDEPWELFDMEADRTELPRPLGDATRAGERTRSLARAMGGALRRAALGRTRATRSQAMNGPEKPDRPRHGASWRSRSSWPCQARASRPRPSGERAPT